MGAKLSKRRHRHAHHGPETTTTMEQDATIGGTGGAVTGLVSGVGFIFVNGLHEALGLRATLSVLGLCAVGGTVVGALVVVAGTLVVKYVCMSVLWACVACLFCPLPIRLPPRPTLLPPIPHKPTHIHTH